MNHVNAAILLVLSAVQSPPPAALASKVVSEDESLRGMSATSVSVQVEGKLIDATATKANIETKLRQRGIRVLDRGLPQLHLQVDYMPTSDGRSTYATFAMRLEFAQALTRPGGAALVEGVTWSDGAFGILGDDVTAKLEARASSMVGEFLGALLSVNPGLAKAAGAAGLGVKQKTETISCERYSRRCGPRGERREGQRLLRRSRPVKPAFGYRVDYQGHSVVISGDTKPSESLVKFSRNVDVLIHELGQSKQAPFLTGPPDELLPNSRLTRRQARTIADHHTDAPEAGQLFQRVQPKLAVFSHYPNIVRADVLRAVTQSYAGRVEFGEDLMTIEIGSAINIRPFTPASK